jgi:HAD superfamily hydrolase (TIGR01509 family)
VAQAYARPVGYDLVVFDCDGVLVDSEILVADVEAALLSEAGYELAAEDILERFVGLSYPTMLASLGAETGRPVPEVLGRRVRQAALDRLARDLKPVPGIDELLDGLSGPRCVASSSDLDRITLSLAVSGLARHFTPEVVFSAQMVERPKPAPDLFQLAASAMGVDAGRCVVIEDSPYGVEGAVRAGMTAVGLVAGGHAGPGLADRLVSAGATVVFDTAADLGRYLSALA